MTDRVWGAPDLVVEVLSPQPRIGLLDERLEWFGRYGVRECWLVHQPEEEIEVLQFVIGEFESRRFYAKEESVVVLSCGWRDCMTSLNVTTWKRTAIEGVLANSSGFLAIPIGSIVGVWLTFCIPPPPRLQRTIRRT